MVIGYVRRTDNNNKEFEQFGRLELNRADFDPSLCTIVGYTYHNNCGVEQQRDAVTKPSETLDPAVIDNHGGKTHSRQTEHRPTEHVCAQNNNCR